MWIALVLFAAIFGLICYLDARKPRNFPPGPKWYPLIGSALFVSKWRKRFGCLYVATAQMAAKYGPVIGLRVGKDLIVVVYGKDAIKEFLTNDDLIGRPTGPFFRMRTWGERLGVLLTDSQLWVEQRKFVLRQLREFGFGRKNMSAMVEEEAAVMIDHLNELIGAKSSHMVLDMAGVFNVHVLNTLWTMLAGTRYSPQDKALKHLQNILGKLFESVDGVGAPFSQFPILKFIAPEISGYKMYVETHTKVWEFLDNELKRHKETYDVNNPRDFMDVYLTILNSSEKKDFFCEKQLLAICMDMFMAGSETTSKSLGYCFLYLILYPDVQRKAQEELDRVIGRNRLPTMEDRPQLPYMECLVLELLRVYSGRAFTLPHRALKDSFLCGYFIPKDAMLVANLHGTLMGPECGVADPEVFNPERFMKDGRLALEETYIPFGFGKRRCLGETLARANVFLFTAALLQHFTFQVPAGDAPTLECVDGITPGPLPYKALITRRD